MPDADSPPSWVDAAFIQKALRRSGDRNALVRSVTFAQVGDTGDHYASCMYRATAKTDKGAKTLIVKTLPEGDHMKETMRESAVFPIETAMFTEVVPGVQKILSGVSSSPLPPLTARCLHHGDQPEEFLVVEDLAPQGFRMVDRKIGLDLRHSLLALRTLARFHAATAALLKKDPSLLDKLPFPYKEDSPKVEFMKQYFDTSFDMAAKACRTWSEKYGDMIDIGKNTIFERFLALQRYDPDRFNVIIHGDFWVNNMMFRYEEGELQSIRLVDLQMSHVTTPVVDLLYFLSTSVSKEVFKNKLDLLLRQYHATLSETLELLGLEPYPREEFLKEVDAQGFYALFGCVFILPIIKAEKTPNMEESLDQGAQAHNFLYTSSSYERWMRVLLPEFHARGWLS